MSVNADRLGGLILLAFFAGYAALISEIHQVQVASVQMDARSMPTFLSAVGILLALYLIARPGDTRASPQSYHWGLAITFCVLMVAYSYAIRPLGFMISTALFLAAGFYCLGARHWWHIGLSSLALPFCTWFIMSELLGVFLELWPNWSSVDV